MLNVEAFGQVWKIHSTEWEEKTDLDGIKTTEIKIYKLDKYS